MFPIVAICFPILLIQALVFGLAACQQRPIIQCESFSARTINGGEEVFQYGRYFDFRNLTRAGGGPATALHPNDRGWTSRKHISRNSLLRRA
jgi:hypothetical protein